MHILLRRLLAVFIISLSLGLNGYSLINLSEGSHISNEVSIFYLGLILIGTIFMLPGILLLKSLYTPKKGIIINPRKLAIIWDSLTIFFATLAALVIVDTILVAVFNIQTIITDEFGQFMGIFFFFVGVPMLTIFVSSMTVQSIFINDYGVTIDGLDGKKLITWSDFENVKVTNQWIIIPRGGIPFPDRIQKQIILKSSKGTRITINEPQFKSIKKEIITQLVVNAPEKWKPIIRERLKNW